MFFDIDMQRYAMVLSLWTSSDDVHSFVMDLKFAALWSHRE